MQKKKLPVGIDDFGKLRREDFYYIDKTGLIRNLLNNWGEVNLFTRPRRFGKTLNMSMLKYFFDGYCFGDAHIYCPWDVVKYTKKLLSGPHAEPEAFWINTSRNDLVKRFIDKADKTVPK